VVLPGAKPPNNPVASPPYSATVSPVATGDDQVERYEALFRTYYALVLGFCIKRLRDRCDAEDAAQETFARALRHVGVFAAPAPWLLRAASHVCTDQVRRQQTQQLLVAALHARLGPQRQAEWYPGDIDELLALLTLSERTVITSTMLEDRSHSDTAALLGIKASTSRVLQSRALKKLRRLGLDRPFQRDAGFVHRDELRRVAVKVDPDEHHG